MTETQVRREALRLVNDARAVVDIALLDDLPHGIRDEPPRVFREFGDRSAVQPYSPRRPT